VAAVHGRYVEPVSRSQRHLVTWHVLAQGAVTVRGPAVGELDIYTNWPALADATRRTAVEYWTPWLDRKARSVVGPRRRTLPSACMTSDGTHCARGAANPHRGSTLYRNPKRRRADLVGFIAEALQR